MELRDALIEAFIRILSRGIYAPGRRDYYGVEVKLQHPTPPEFDLTLTFKSGERYCCTEPSCHLGCWTRHEWERLRSELSSLDAEPLQPMIIRSIVANIEQGSAFGLTEPGDMRPLAPEHPRSFAEGPYVEILADAE